MTYSFQPFRMKHNISVIQPVKVIYKYTHLNKRFITVIILNLLYMFTYFTL